MGDFLCGMAWAAIGCGSYTFWWTRTYFLVRTQVPFVILTAIMGPLAFPWGWWIHGSDDAPIPTMKDAIDALVRLREKGVEPDA